MSRDRFNQDKIEDIIKKSYEDIDIEIPRGIAPDNINITGNKGAEYDEEDVPEFDIDTANKNVKRKRIYKTFGMLAGAAAAIVCIVMSAKLAGDGNLKIQVPVKIENSDNETGQAVDGQENIADSGELSYKTADSYEDIYDIVSEYVVYRTDYNEGLMIDEFVRDDAADMATSEQNSVSKGESANREEAKTESANGDTEAQNDKESFSDTNVQVEGVDEADIIKTDGKYIYVLGNSVRSKSNYIAGGVVNIVSAADGKMEKVADIRLLDDIDAFELEANEMYLCDNRLVVIVNDYDSDLNSNGCVAMIYDVSDPITPKHIDNVSMSGMYENSRVSDGYLYLISRFYIQSNIDIDDYETYIPKVDDRLIENSCICIEPDIRADSYVIMMAVDIGSSKKTDECEVKDKKAMLGSSCEMYVSRNSIYLFNEANKDGMLVYKARTQITKYDYLQGKIKYAGKTKVDGYVDSQFSADEYNGNLRMVTTLDVVNHINGKRIECNSLYVLNDKLEIIGSIEKIARDERIYSARFYGDYGYFVTYREMDPLFTADLSNPEEPKIVSELELPGFSDYLQGFGPDRLFGIGYDTINNGNDTFRQDTLKISMFNISDKENVKEEHTLKLKDYDRSEACSNHKSLLISYDRNLIGFPANAYRGYGELSNYLVYSYGKNGFKLLGELDTAKDMNTEVYDVIGQRGMFIGDYLYIIQRNQGIVSYELDGLEKVDVVRF